MELKLSPCQERARKEFNEFLSGSSDDTCFILTGGPGRGKSFATKVLINDARKNYKMQVHLTATTNKAAKVLGDFVEEEVITIHSLFGLRVRNNFKTGGVSLATTPSTRVISNALIAIDEGSMADTPLWNIVKQYTHNCKFLIIGDKDQLAPVSESHPPLFNMGWLTCELETVMRQAADSEIVGLANQWRHTIRTGEFYPIVAAGVDVEYVDGERFRELVHKHFTEDTPADKYKIICWRNDTVKQYNNYIRDRFFPEEHYVPGEVVVTNNPIMDRDGTVYSTDELATIMEVKPGTEMGVAGYWYRLDRGISVFCATDNNQVKALINSLAGEAKQTGSWLQYFNAKDFFADLRPVHACTAFKAQGSSYDAVFIDLEDVGQCKEWSVVARMLYVAITRARKKVYLYGNLPKRYAQFAYKV